MPRPKNKHHKITHQVKRTAAAIGSSSGSIPILTDTSDKTGEKLDFSKFLTTCKQINLQKKKDCYDNSPERTETIRHIIYTRALHSEK